MIESVNTLLWRLSLDETEREGEDGAGWREVGDWGVDGKSLIFPTIFYSE